MPFNGGDSEFPQEDREAAPLVHVPAASAELARPFPTLGTDPLAHYLATLHSRESRRSVLSVLGRAARTFAALDGAADAADRTARSYAWGAAGGITYAKVNAHVALVGEGGHAPVARLTLAALRGVARAAFNLRLLSTDERRRIDDVRGPKLSGSTRGRRLTDGEVRRLFDACARDPSPLGRRDGAILAVMLGCGLRRFEVSALDLADFRIPERGGREVTRLVVRHGKGGQHAVVIGPPDVALAVEDWLGVRECESGPLFSSSPGRGRPLRAGSRLSPSGVYGAIIRRAVKAEIAAAAPHDMRRTMITTMLERTGDLALAQRLARHKSPATTVRYDKRGEAALERALAGARSGYVGR